MFTDPKLLFFHAVVSKQAEKVLVYPSMLLSTISTVRPRGYKKNFMLEWAEHAIFPAHKCYNSNQCWHFNIYQQNKIAFYAYLSLKMLSFYYIFIYEHLKYHAQLS